jgi:hypothetical protein
MQKISSFQPIINSESKILILGSIPGIKSLKCNNIMLILKTNFGK